MHERKSGAPEEPMLFGMPLSKFPKAPPLDERQPTLWELFKLGLRPPFPDWPFSWPARRQEPHG